ncbi:MAG: hypothetical protein ACOYYI_18720 [Chloroflexota bacterium]
MNTSAQSALQRERDLFGELFARLRDSLLNRLFDLSPARAARRRAYLTVLFLLSGVVIILYYYPPAVWTEPVRKIFNVLLSETSTAAQLEAAINDFGRFLLAVLTDARILQYIPVFFASFFMALHSAAIYLADIFELEDVSVARKFISSVALGGSDLVIHIRAGEVEEESRSSPAYLIGGPAKVVVALDSVALFERADGTPHVIGPTGGKPGGKESLDGFERFRQAFDLRDHFIELRGYDDNSKPVESRSLDGIPVKAVDVRFMFSVFRGDNPKRTDENPYPFVEDAVKNLVYKAASRVAPEQESSSVLDPLWRITMTALIRKRLGDFMSLHKLTEYLASIGAPEVEKAQQREDTIFREIQELTRAGEELERKDIKPPPPFFPRPQIKDLFERFAEDFTSQANESGVELHWIGVGTWEVPAETIPQKHLDAWEQTQKNLKDGSDDAMKKVNKEATFKKMKELIAKVPLGAFEQIIAAAKPSKKAKAEQKKEEKTAPEKPEPEEEKMAEPSADDEIKEILEVLQNLKDDKKEEADPKTPSHDHQIKALLLAYRNHIKETIEFLRAKNEQVPENLVSAVRFIDNLGAHWVGN